jgi:hypothetical protein
LEICEKTGLETFVFVGYILNNAFSLDEKRWENIFKLVTGHLLLARGRGKEEEVISKNDLMEG